MNIEQFSEDWKLTKILLFFIGTKPSRSKQNASTHRCIHPAELVLRMIAKNDYSEHGIVARIQDRKTIVK